MRDVPAEIDHAVVGMTADGAEENEDAQLTILMDAIRVCLRDSGGAQGRVHVDRYSDPALQRRPRARAR